MEPRYNTNIFLDRLEELGTDEETLYEMLLAALEYMSDEQVKDWSIQNGFMEPEDYEDFSEEDVFDESLVENSLNENAENFEVLVNILQKICDDINDEECEDVAHVTRDYSGRGMFGAICPGIIAPKTVQVDIIAGLIDAGKKDLAKSMAIDNMGLEFIFYFPYIRKAANN